MITIIKKEARELEKFFLITTKFYKILDFNFFIKKEHKASRGEKKFKKAMTKLGMKPVTGINRVTIKRAKSVIIK